MEVVQLLGSQGFWQHQILRGLSASEAGNIEGYGNQYWPIRSRILAREHPYLTEQPAGCSLQGRKESDMTEVTLRA